MVTWFTLPNNDYIATVLALNSVLFPFPTLSSLRPPLSASPPALPLAPSMSKGPTALAITLGGSTAGVYGLSTFAKGGQSLIHAYLISMAMQFVMFLHASGIVFGNAPTERFYDLTGSTTFVVLTLLSLHWNWENVSLRRGILASLVLIWALRLGTFLFERINRDGGIDHRFTEAKKNPYRFAIFWTLQGLWVFITAFPVLLVQSLDPGKKNSNLSLSSLDYLGLLIWLVGFGVEVIADNQKKAFKLNPKNENKFIHTGLWSISRHPNYFGEISLWIGVFLVSMSEYTSKRQYVAIISPVFVASLLIFVSGVPLLEKSSDRKFGYLKDYQEYKRKTSVLVPYPRLALTIALAVTIAVITYKLTLKF